MTCETAAYGFQATLGNGRPASDVAGVIALDCSIVFADICNDGRFGVHQLLEQGIESAEVEVPDYGQ